MDQEAGWIYRLSVKNQWKPDGKGLKNHSSSGIIIIITKLDQARRKLWQFHQTTRRQEWKSENPNEDFQNIPKEEEVSEVSHKVDRPSCYPARSQATPSARQRH